DLPPHCGLLGDDRIRVVQRLVAEDRLPAVLIVDVPVRFVRAHEREVRAVGQRCGEGVAHALRPVLVMARDYYQAMSQQAGGVGAAASRRTKNVVPTFPAAGPLVRSASTR